MQLFVNFPCYAIVCEFHHVVQWFMNFIILCNCGHELLLGCCWDVVGIIIEVLLGCCWDVVGIIVEVLLG